MESDRVETDIDVRVALADWRAQVECTPPEPMRLAAWLDGHLGEREAGDIERALAADPALLAGVLTARQAYSAVTVDPRWPLTTWFAALRQPVYAAALLLLCAVGTGGFALGRALADVAQQQTQAAARALITEPWLPLDGDV